MSTSVLILGAVFVGVALLVVAIAMLLRDKSVSQMEDRLNTLTGKGDRSDGSLAELSQLVAAQRGDRQGPARTRAVAVVQPARGCSSRPTSR